MSIADPLSRASIRSVDPVPVVVLVDDDTGVLAALSQTLELLGYCPRAFSGAVAALESGAIETAVCVITDVRMPEMDGMALLERIVARPLAPPVVLLTAYGDVASAVAAMKKGAYDFLVKPADNAVVASCVARAAQKRQLELRNQDLEQQLALALAGPETPNFGILGRSAAIQELLKRIRQYAQSPQPVLIVGETGVGKELAAAAIHQASPRAGKPYITANVGAIPETLVASELFGHEKGAFTNAHARREGLFELASGGTLLLDEIECAPLWLQVQLLRAVENHRIMRVGGTKEFAVDARIVATSNQPLEELMRKGAFREDLYYRLSSLRLRVPPLRERLEDIPELVARFVARFAADTGRPPLRVDGRALAGLQAHHWPGNVRELQNAVATLFATCEDGVIREWRPDNQGLGVGAGSGLREKVEAYERALIVEALRETKGRINETCKTLAIPRKSLYDRMKKHGLDRRDFE